MNEELRGLFESFNEKPIAYHRIYSKITGSITAGLLLSQLLYWAKTMEYKEFYKTDKDFADELGMGLYELKGAKKKLNDLGLVSIKRKGVPAKTYYKVNVEKVITLITSYGKNPQLDDDKTHNWNEEKPTTIYTENTTENKTNISKEIQTAPPIRQDISNFLEYFKQQLGASLDNTVKSNRLYAKLLLDKLKKDFPDLDPEQQAKLLVDLALADNWHSKNATTAQYIYYNKQKIIQSHTHRNVNRSRFTSI